MFTQLNQYHVVLEVKPDFHRHAHRSARSLFVRTGATPINSSVVAGGTARRSTSGPTSSATAVPGQRQSTGSSNAAGRGHRIHHRISQRRPSSARRVQHHRDSHRAHRRSTIRASFRWSRSRSIWLPTRRSAKPWRRSTRPRTKLDCRASIQAAYQGSAEAFQASLANEPVLILAALVTVYIVLGVLYESYIHPITILSTLPSAGVGALLALYHHAQRFQRHRAHRHRAADRHRQEERHHDDRFRPGSRAPRGQGASATPFSRLSAALPPDHDDHHGGAAGRRSAGARHRRGLGAAAAARHHDRRRLDLQPDADALHHAGNLSVLRSPGDPILAPASRNARRWRRPAQSPEPSLGADSP